MILKHCMLLAKYLFYISFWHFFTAWMNMMVTPLLLVLSVSEQILSCCTKTVIRHSDKVYIRKKSHQSRYHICHCGLDLVLTQALLLFHFDNRLTDVLIIPQRFGCCLEQSMFINSYFVQIQCCFGYCFFMYLLKNRI